MGDLLAHAHLMGALSPALAAKRIDLHDADGRHIGYAIVDRRAGRVDYYDLRERRMGWGRVNALSERYRVDLFGAHGQAVGYAIVDLDMLQAEFLTIPLRLIGSGWFDRRGHVMTFDLSGQRRSDTALPIPKWRPVQREQPSD
jgi:hypothetical protein